MLQLHWGLNISWYVYFPQPMRFNAKKSDFGWFGGYPIEETPGCFKDVIPAPVAPSRWRAPRTHPQSDRRRWPLYWQGSLVIPNIDDSWWFMINVGKTIINHPQNHHGWYTPSKWDGLWHCFTHIYVEKYLLGLDTVHDGIACLQRQELCMRNRRTCLPKGHSCSCFWFQTPFVLVKTVNSWCWTSPIGDIYLSWRDEGFFAAFDGWNFRFPTWNPKAVLVVCLVFPGFCEFFRVFLGCCLICLLVFSWCFRVFLRWCVLVVSCFCSVFSWVLNGVSGTRLLINWALNLWQSGLNRTETWFFTEVSPFFSGFWMGELPRNSPKTPSLHLLGCTKSRVAARCAQAVASGPTLHLGMMMTHGKMADLMGFSC